MTCFIRNENVDQWFTSLSLILSQRLKPKPNNDMRIWHKIPIKTPFTTSNHHLIAIIWCHESSKVYSFNRFVYFIYANSRIALLQSRTSQPIILQHPTSIIASCHTNTMQRLRVTNQKTLIHLSMSMKTHANLNTVSKYDCQSQLMLSIVADSFNTMR